MNGNYKYKYEIHLHTSRSSACGKTEPRDYIRPFIEAGYDGIFVTDHFYRGNTAVPRELPWHEWVENYCRGYEEAKEEGDRLGLKVFFGWEENNHGDEYLVFGPGKEWLSEHPEMTKWTTAERLREVHKAGGIVIQAHPFRERDYLTRINLHPCQADAMEVCNAGNPAYQDTMAYNYCLQRKIRMVAGSDIHDVSSLKSTPTGMLFERPLESVQDFVKAILSGEGYMPIIPDERKEIDPGKVSYLPVYQYDREEKSHKVELSELFPGIIK